MKKITYVTSAMLMALSLASCNKVPKASSVRDDLYQPKTTTATTSMTTTSVTTTETTTVTEPETTTEEPTTTIGAITSPIAETTIGEATCGADEIYVEPLNGYDGVWYTAVDLNHTAPPCGASGNQLVPGYSVASDYFPFGTVLYIESEYMNGMFRVDDCGVGSSNTIDFYFYDRTQIPDGFLQAGRMPITITVIE